MDSTLTTLGIAGAVALAIGFLLNPASKTPGDATGGNWATSNRALADSPKPRPLWAASATGRIEPRDGEIRVGSQVPGKIAEVTVKAGDRVMRGDLLVHLDDEDALTRVAAAESEAQVRLRERDEEEATGVALERRKAEDALAEAERAYFRARLALDTAVAKWRAGRGPAEDVTAARARQADAENRVGIEKGALARVLERKNMPLPTRLESSLAAARSDLLLAESAVDKARVRAPFDGTALNVNAKVGETVAPSPEAPLVMFGDVSALRVRAEVEERDAAKVRVGQRVVLRADAYPDREFEGRVSSIAQSLGTPRIASRGPRRPNDVEVLEVVADLDGSPPLLTGMRVDVFFRLDATADSNGKAPAAK
jgi:HlyD family secretion protein